MSSLLTWLPVIDIMSFWQKINKGWLLSRGEEIRNVLPSQNWCRHSEKGTLSPIWRNVKCISRAQWMYFYQREILTYINCWKCSYSEKEIVLILMECQINLNEHFATWCIQYQWTLTEETNSNLYSIPILNQIDIHFHN